MNEKPESRKTKARSPNFPFITLEKALERARQFYDKEKRSAAPLPVAAEHWQYSASSSGVLQTAAALKSYGLMSDEGTGDARQLRLTELALRILLDSRPDSSERDSFRRQAALAPAVASDIYARWEGRLPSLANLNHYLVLDKGFSEEAASKVADIIFLNELFTTGVQSMVESSIREIDADKEAAEPAYNPAGPVGPSLPVWRSSGPVAAPLPPRRPAGESASQMPPGKQLSMPDSFTGSRHIVGSGSMQSGADRVQGLGSNRRDERLIGPTGDILLSFFGEPTWEAYEFLRMYIELRKSMLKPTTPFSLVKSPPSISDT